jgi:hypothetical protein
MTSAASLALSFQNLGTLEKALAVLGGAVLGGFVIGLFVQLLVRALTARKLPRWPLLAVRLLGALLTGWLVALWVFGGAGPGLGGSGGWGFGSGTGAGQGTTPQPGAVEQGPTPEKKPGAEPTPAGPDSLRVEILGDAALEKSAGAGFDHDRRYRVEGKDGPRLLGFDELKEFVKQRQKQQPPLRRIEIVLYEDSPAPGVPLVSRLEAWARDLPVKGNGKVTVDVSSPGREAPIGR